MISEISRNRLDASSVVSINSKLSCRISFLQFFSRFQHFSNSISLSLSLFIQAIFHESCSRPYIPVRLTFHSFGQLRRSKNILFDRERNFDTCSSSPPRIVSIQVGGRKLHISTRRPSFVLFDFTSLVRKLDAGNEETGSCVRLDRWVDVDGSLRAKQPHKYRNVVRTDSGTEQSPFRNTCCLAPFF